MQLIVVVVGLLVSFATVLGRPSLVLTASGEKRRGHFSGHVRVVVEVVVFCCWPRGTSWR